MFTCFGEEVDERVRLAALEQLHQLGAAVQTDVVDAQTPLAPGGGVEQGTLGNTDRRTRLYNNSGGHDCYQRSAGDVSCLMI